jgi:hypothetical protein
MAKKIDLLVKTLVSGERTRDELIESVYGVRINACANPGSRIKSINKLISRAKRSGYDIKCVKHSCRQGTYILGGDHAMQGR